MKIIKTNKFSDVFVLIRTMLPLNRQTITAMNLLVFMMRAKTKDLDTKQKISMAFNSTYGMQVSYGLTGYGKQVALDIRFKYLRQDYVQEPDYIQHVVDNMEQMLHQVVLDDETLEEAKYLLKTRLMRQMDDPDSIAIKNALMNAQENHEISLQIQGYMEDIDSISLDQILNLYADFMQTSKQIYVCGAVDSAVANFLKQEKQLNQLQGNFKIIKPQEKKKICIEKEISQTSLVQVYATQVSLDSTMYYPLLVMNSILGQCPMNLLFEEVREKNSYCYSISSNLIRFDGALVIVVGTNKNNVEDVQNLIQQQIFRLAQGNFDDRLLEIAKTDLVDGIRSQKDHAFSMIEQSFLDDLLHRSETSEDKISKIRNVTRQEVQKVAKRLCLVSISIVEEK